MKNIDYKKIKRYDIGKMPTSSGYQFGNLITNTYSDLKLATLYNNPISNTLIAISGLSKAANTIPSIASGFNTWSTIAGAGKANIAAATSKGLIDNAGNWTLAAVDLGTGLNLGEKATGRAAESALKAAGHGTSAISTAANVLNGVTSVVGMITGGMGIAKDIAAFDNNISESDMLKSSALSTLTKFGQQYTTYGGFDAQGMTETMSQQNKADTTNLILDSIGTGASIGSLAGLAGGSWAGPIGMGIGALLGTLFGGLFGSSASQKRFDELQRRINNTNMAISGYNLQSESEAGSKGLRNQFAQTHSADKGKPENKSFDDYTNISPVYTAQGTTVAPMNALAGKGESIVNFNKGTASYIKEGTKRVDNIPVSVEADDAIIGNGTDPKYKMKYSEMAAPFTLHMEYINSLKPNTKDSATMKVYEREAKKATARDLAALKLISDRQSIYEHGVDPNTGQKLMFDKGKMPKYDAGKYVPYLMSALPALSGIGTNLAQYLSYLSETPTAYNTYVANPNASQAYRMMLNRYNVYPQLNQINDATRQGQYAIRQTGGLSGGQQAKMLANLYSSMAKNKNAVYNAAEEYNNKNNQAVAAAMLEEGRNEATRRQQAEALYRDQYAKAVASRRRGMDTALAGITGSINSMFLNFNNNYWTDKNLSLYQQELDSKKAAAASKMNPTAPTYKFNPSTMNIYSGLPIWMQQHVKPFNLSTT